MLVAERRPFLADGAVLTVLVLTVERRAFSFSKPPCREAILLLLLLLFIIIIIIIIIITIIIINITTICYLNHHHTPHNFYSFNFTAIKIMWCVMLVCGVGGGWGGGGVDG